MATMDALSRNRPCIQNISSLGIRARSLSLFVLLFLSGCAKPIPMESRCCQRIKLVDAHVESNTNLYGGDSLNARVKSTLEKSLANLSCTHGAAERAAETNLILEIKPTMTRSDAVIQYNLVPEKQKYKMVLAYSLKQNQTILLQGRVMSITTFLLPISSYAYVLTEEEAQKQGIEDAVAKLSAKLRLYLMQHDLCCGEANSTQ